jgi:hypothetical protein
MVGPGRKTQRLKVLLHILYNPSLYPQRAVEKAAASIAEQEVSQQRMKELRYRQTVKGKREAAAAQREASRDKKNFTL